MTGRPDWRGAVDGIEVLQGDCRDVLADLPAESVDAVVTDPPYGLNFMGRSWDAPAIAEALVKRRRYRRVEGTGPAGGYRSAAAAAGRYDFSENEGFQVWCESWAVEVLRVLKPGGHLVAFGGTRTWHRLASGIEDAGFEIRDNLAWLYGSGFPKSVDLTEAVAAWRRGESVPDLVDPDVYEVTAYLRAARDAAGWSNRQIDELFGTAGMAGHWTTSGQQPRTPSVRQWQVLKGLLGFGDDVDGIVERYDVQERPEDWGAGREDERFLDTLGKDGTAGAAGAFGSALKPAFEPVVLARRPVIGSTTRNVQVRGTGALNLGACRVGGDDDEVRGSYTVKRWKPGADLIRDGGTWKQEGVDAPTVTRELPGGRWPPNVLLDPVTAREVDRQAPDVGASGRASGPSRTGSVARGVFNGTDRPAAFHADRGGASRLFPVFRYEPKAPRSERPRVDGVEHETVKPLDLMRWLVRLVTPPGGTVLDPFAGSGTTLEAGILEGFRVIGVEREARYLPLIDARVRRALNQPAPLFDLGGDLAGGVL